MTIPESAFGAHARERLRREKLIRLVTIGADATPPDANEDHLAKYQQPMLEVSGSPAALAHRYAAPVRITIDCVRGY